MSTALRNTIALGADHAGYELKNHLLKLLSDQGYTTINLGTDTAESVDYPDYARAVAEAIQNGKAGRGIVVCGSGAGACIAANKMNGIRAALAHDTYTAHQAVEHDDANVLCLGARIIGYALAEDIVNSWVNAEFTNDKRHARRLEKVMSLETKQQ